MESLPAKAGGVPSCKNYGLQSRENPIVIEMFRVYTNLVERAGWIRGYGAFIDDPSLHALPGLVRTYTEASILPPEIRKHFPKPFKEVEDAIKLCAKTEAELRRAYETFRMMWENAEFFDLIFNFDEVFQFFTGKLLRKKRLPSSRLLEMRLQLE